MPEEVDLPIETDTAGQRFSRVVKEGRPADRRAGRRLAHDPDRVIPEIFFASEPWGEISLGLSREGFDLWERHVKRASAAQGVETVINVLSEQEQGELGQNPLPANSRETRGLAHHRLFRPPVEPEAQLGDEASGAQEPKRVLG